jgi:hypothetical protein
MEALVKGIIFNLLEEAVGNGFGPETWDTLLENAGLDGAYTSIGSYPDEDILKLVGAAAAMLDQPAEDILRWFGVAAIPLLFGRYPVFFTPHQGSRSFLLTLNDIIHPEVRKLYPGADVPDFTYQLTAASDDSLTMVYQSKRQLCTLAEGFIQGSAAHYGEIAEIGQRECMHRGDARCVFDVAIRKASI